MVDWIAGYFVDRSLDQLRALSLRTMPEGEVAEKLASNGDI